MSAESAQLGIKIKLWGYECNDKDENNNGDDYDSDGDDHCLSRFSSF